MWGALLGAVIDGTSSSGGKTGGGGAVYSVESTANLNADATGGPMWGDFRASPIYNKSPLDNPLVLAAIVGLVALYLWKRKG